MPGPGHASLVALLAGDPRRQSQGSRIACSRRFPLHADYAQALAVLAVSRTFRRSYGFPGGCANCAVSIAERSRIGGGSWPTARTLGRISRLLPRMCTCAASKTRLLTSDWLCASIRSFALAQGYYGPGPGIRRAVAGEAPKLPAMRCVYVPRDPFLGCLAMASPPMRSLSDAALMRAMQARARERSGGVLDFVSAYRLLAAAAAMAGDNDLAKAMIQEVRRVQPDITLDWMARQMPVNEAQRERYAEALRRAGLNFQLKSVARAILSSLSVNRALAHAEQPHQEPRSRLKRSERRTSCPSCQ